MRVNMAQGKTDPTSNPDSKKPSWTGDDLSAMLRRYDRSPFLDLLAAWMECAPTATDIAALAAKKPDLWVKALSDLAKMGGYTEKQETIHTVRLDQLSDSQLEDRAKAIARKLGLPIPEDITLLARPISDRTIDIDANPSDVQP